MTLHRTRRQFLAAGAGAAILAADAEAAMPRVLRVGLAADVHYADADARGTRHYRDSLAKMWAAVDQWNRVGVDAAVELGDLIDSPGRADPAAELGFLRAIDAEFRRARCRRIHVLGNHCVAALSKADVLRATHERRAYQWFDHGSVRLVCLDACYRRDGAPYDRGNFEWTDCDVPEGQRRWLAGSLAACRGKAVVIVHQRLDLPVDNPHTVRSAPAVREILSRSAKVIAVVMGHSHQNELTWDNGIPYITLRAMVEGAGAENNAFAVLSVANDGTPSFDGYGRMSTHPAAVPGALAQARAAMGQGGSSDAPRAI